MFRCERLDGRIHRIHWAFFRDIVEPSASGVPDSAEATGSQCPEVFARGLLWPPDGLTTSSASFITIIVTIIGGPKGESEYECLIMFANLH